MISHSLHSVSLDKTMAYGDLSMNQASTSRLPDASRSHARSSLLLAAKEMSSRGLDNGANWALDLASCLPSTATADSGRTSPHLADESNASFGTTTPARTSSSLPRAGNPSGNPPSMYPMQSTPFLGVQPPSSSSFRQDLSSPQPSRHLPKSRSNNLSPLVIGPSSRGQGLASPAPGIDQSLSGRFPSPFRQPHSPLSNLSFSAERDRSANRSHPLSISHEGDTTSSDGDQSMQEDQRDQPDGQEAEEDSRSAHVRFASEGRDSSLAESELLDYYSHVPERPLGHDRFGSYTSNDGQEIALYEYALSCFRTGQLERCKWQLDRCKAQMNKRARRESDKTVFLRNYVSMLIIERHAASDSVFALPSSQTSTNLTKSFVPLLKDGLIDPTDPFLLFLKGIVLRKLHKRIEAMDCFVRSIAAFPYNWTAWLELNAVLETSAGELEEVLPLLPDSFMTLLFLEHHHRQSAATKDPQANIDRIETLLDLFPDNAGLWNNFAMQKYLQRDFETAIELFQKARSLDPFVVEGLADYSNALFLTERGEELAHLAHTTSEWGSETSEVCCVIGNHLYFQSEQTRAIEAFKRAIKLDPNSVGAWILLGHGYVEVKNTSAAMEMYRRAIEINPRDFRPWHGLGKVYELMEAWTFACKYYLKAAGLAPYTSQVWSSLGLSYRKLNMSNEAISAYQRQLSCENVPINVQLPCIRTILEILQERYQESQKQNLIEAFKSGLHNDHSTMTEEIKQQLISWHFKVVDLISQSMSASSEIESEQETQLQGSLDQLGIDVETDYWIIHSFIHVAKLHAGFPTDSILDLSLGGVDIKSGGVVDGNLTMASQCLKRILEWTGGIAVESSLNSFGQVSPEIEARQLAARLWNSINLKQQGLEQ
ncbi:unnamed protein product [Sympodiomycopsis kandeliae]